jgi:hypothetical protein
MNSRFKLSFFLHRIVCVLFTFVFTFDAGIYFKAFIDSLYFEHLWASVFRTLLLFSTVGVYCRRSALRVLWVLLMIPYTYSFSLGYAEGFAIGYNGSDESLNGVPKIEIWMYFLSFGVGFGLIYTPSVWLFFFSESAKKFHDGSGVQKGEGAKIKGQERVRRKI